MNKETSAIAAALENGFSQKPKRLPSWLFYDASGDKLFLAITETDEYYLTRCEFEILGARKDDLLRLFNSRGPFNLIELGAGTGIKTEILLKHFSDKNINFTYTPIDVSENALQSLASRLVKSIPRLKVLPINGRYNDALLKLRGDDSRKVFLFLGATIGNFAPADAIDFVGRVAAAMKDDDLFLIGFDLKKDPRVIQAAYDDRQGKTRDFNMNLLTRLNREAGADFNLEKFQHYASYNPETGQNRSYLVSTASQDVFVKAISRSVHFHAWEVIHTEISQKHDPEMIESLASQADLEVVQYFYDSKEYFCDVLFRQTK